MDDHGLGVELPPTDNIYPSLRPMAAHDSILSVHVAFMYARRSAPLIVVSHEQILEAAAWYR